VECYSAEDVRNHIKTADVVLLDNGYRHVPFWDEITFINKSPAFTSRFYVDLWHTRENGAPRDWNEDSIKFDVRITACKELQKKFKPEWAKVFWSPHCIDVQGYCPPRDIDVLFWGACSPQYAFRQFIRQALRERVVKKIVKVDSFFTIREVAIRGNSYRYGLVDFVPNPVNWKPSREQAVYGYYGPRLFRLLSRVKVCCTSPVHRAPIGKFFENAACGSVTLTTDFTDRKELGFEHGKHLWITGEHSFVDDLAHLLEHPDLVEEMSKNAKELIRTRHTPAIRAQELYEFLRREVGG